MNNTSFLSTATRLFSLLLTLLALLTPTRTAQAAPPNQWSSNLDFDGNGFSDILLYRDNQTPGYDIIRILNSKPQFNIERKFEELTLLGPNEPKRQLIGSGRFDGDWVTDLVWRESTTRYRIDKRSSTGLVTARYFSNPDPRDYVFIGIGDFNGDSTSDVLWRSKQGYLMIYQFSNDVQSSYKTLFTSNTNGKVWVPEFFQCAGIGDFNGDQKSDIFWIDANGATYFWGMNGATITEIQPGPSLGGSGNWRVAGTGDVCSAPTTPQNMRTTGKSDGICDILWEVYTGGNRRTKKVWQISPGFRVTARTLDQLENHDIQSIGDYDGDTSVEILTTSLGSIYSQKITPANNATGTLPDGSCLVETSFISYLKPMGDSPDNVRPRFEGGFDLRLHLRRQLERRGVPPRTSANSAYEAYSYSNTGMIRHNPSSWLGDLDLSGMGFNATDNFCAGGGTAIGKRWVVLAKHVYDGEWYTDKRKNKDQSVCFLDKNNRFYKIRIESFHSIPNSDITLGYLASDIPATVKIYAVLPGPMSKFLESTEKLPGFTRNQFGRLIGLEIDPSYSNLSSFTDPEFSPSSEALVVGDSGNPVCVVIDGEPVLTGCLYRSDLKSRGTSSPLFNHLNQIDKLMEAKNPADGVRRFSLGRYLIYEKP